MQNEEFFKIILRTKENEFVTISALKSKRKKLLQFVRQGSGENLKNSVKNIPFGYGKVTKTAAVNMVFKEWSWRCI